MPDVVRAEPDGQRDQWVGERARAGDALELARHRRGQPDDDEQRPPLGEDDVLQQVHDEQVVQGERVERRDLNREHQRAAQPEANGPPARGGEARQRDRVGGCHPRNDDQSIGIPGAYLTAFRMTDHLGHIAYVCGDDWHITGHCLFDNIW